jgi:hypothetical protein
VPPRDQVTFDDDSLYDLEAALQIRSSLGPAAFESVDTSKASIIPSDRPTGLKGFSTGEGFEDSDFANYYQLENQALLDAGKEGLKDNRIYALGGRNATLPLFAHEFRHTAGILTDDFDQEEEQNRVWDGFRADSQASWDQAIAGWEDLMLREDRSRRFIPKDEVEESLLAAIDRNQERFATQEGESEFAENTRITGVHGFNEDLDEYKGLSIERFNQRQQLIEDDQ